MKKLSILFTAAAMITFVACSDNKEKSKPEGPQPDETTEVSKTTTTTTTTSTDSKAETKDVAEYDPHRGEGKWNAENVKVGALDAGMAAKGEAIAKTKCFTCHKPTTEKLVGPGWAGVTKVNKPEWIMNFISNPDPMLEKDPKIKEQLEICGVRMPNQALTDTDAREVLEFMRKNDGVK